MDLREPEQLALLEQFASTYYPDMPFRAERAEGLRYNFENPSYAYCDGSLLHCMIRHVRPGRIIEVGSGFSSCMTLDTNDLFFDGSTDVTFIEPHPEALLSLVGDGYRPALLESRLQDVDLEVFDVLESGDILFIDSTHVSKVGSDVNRLFFEVLPRLAPGVYVHIHDIAFPFEYPPDWVYEGRGWNEAYMLRTFLEYNDRFRIVLMNTFMIHFHESFFEERMPLCLKNAGSSIWIVKE